MSSNFTSPPTNTAAKHSTFLSDFLSWFSRNSRGEKAVFLAGAGIFAYTGYKMFTNWNMPRVTHLIVYPVKGCKGIEVKEATINKRGFQYDRKWMIVSKKKDAEGAGEALPFVTQRQIPQMTLLRTELIPLKGGETGVTLWYINEDGDRVECSVTKLNTTDKRKVTIWFKDFEAFDEGDEMAEFLTTFFNQFKKPEKQTHEYRLVRSLEDDTFGRKATRPFVDNLPEHIDTTVDFADGFPFLLVSQQSVDDFNKNLTDIQVGYDRFRPNIVIAGKGAPAFDEENWKCVTIEGIEFYNPKTCTRCTVPAIDQTTGKRDLSVAAALQKHRGGVMDGKDVTLFGVNLCSEAKNKMIHVGDMLTVVSRHDKKDYEERRQE